MNNNSLLELHSVLRLYCANLSNLHWNSCGEEFNDAHVNITDGLIDLFHKWIDPVGEMLTRLDINPLNYAEVFDLIKNSSNDYFIADSTKRYNRKEIITIADVMLKDIVTLLCSVLESEEMKATINAGIKSELEGMLNDFDLQYRYLNKRRLSCNTPAVEVVPTTAPEEPAGEEEVPTPAVNEEDNPAGPMEDDAGSSENECDAPDGVCPECGNSPCTCSQSSSEGDPEMW